MKRILVTGNTGSGKSTLARRIASSLGLPFHSLDRVVWQPGWRKTPQEERDRQIRELTDTESWVIDGVCPVVQDRADAVVFLDVPRRVSFWRVFKRNWRFLFRSRPELPPGCPEVLVIPTLCRIIWNFPVKVRPGILNHLRQPGTSQRLVHVQTKINLAEFLATIER